MIKYGYKGLKKIKNLIETKELKEKWRNGIKDFTRKRKMDFKKLIHYILNKRGLSTNMEINNFYDKINENTELTVQSLLNQRLKLNPDVFLELNKEYLRGFYTEYKDIDVKTYKGYILKAIDGSDFEIPNTQRSRETYGRIKDKTGESIPRTSVSMCYDILNKYIIDVIPEKYRTSEISMAKRHVKKDKEITEDYESIYIMDRNYVSMESIIFFNKRNIKFLSRLKSTYYQKEVERMKSDDEIVELEHTEGRLRKKNFEEESMRQYAKKQKSTRVRIIKYRLETGEIEY